MSGRRPCEELKCSGSKEGCSVTGEKHCPQAGHRGLSVAKNSKRVPVTRKCWTFLKHCTSNCRSDGETQTDGSPAVEIVGTFFLISEHMTALA